MQEYKTIEEWQETIGENIRNLRLQRNLDQRELSRQAGISLTAVKRLESGKASTTKTLIAVIRIMNRTDWFNSLAPIVSVNPLDPGNLLTPRQRVFSKRNRQ